jgi:KipI family sensor histidine kinase inhibitor
MKASVVPYGDRAVLVEVGDISHAHRAAAAVEAVVRDNAAPVGVDDIVVGFHSVVVLLDGHADGHGPAVVWLDDLVSEVADHHRAAGESAAVPSSERPVLEIPVDFDGPDLDAVAAAIGVDPGEVVSLLTGAELEVAFLGFSPGFPYLVGLPPELAAVPRRSAPRSSVPAGSVAIAGGFASVYPQSTPGGWMVLGSTATRLFDPDHPPYARVRPGDGVHFRSGGAGHEGTVGVRSPSGTVSRPPLRTGSRRWAEVIRPGVLSLVQDGGRIGVAGLGVPGAGPADPDSMVLANRLVGNADGAAAVEITVAGPALRFNRPAHCAVVGRWADAVEATIDGHPCGDGAVVPVDAGQVLSVGQVRSGLRAYLAVSGGLSTPEAVGSRSSDLLCGLGPGPLVTGDRLALGPPGRPHGILSHSATRMPDGPATVVRVMEGPHRLGDDAWDHLIDQEWAVRGDSNRIGVRLGGRRPVPVAGGRSIPSTGMVTGAIQVPPDGNPIILLPDHATVGGYPVVGCVISADLAVVGQLAPGDAVRFSPVDPEGARRAAVQRERTLATRVSGWFPTTAGS